MSATVKRCWKTEEPLYAEYHDKEWGVPLHDDSRLFEFLILEGFQAGLGFTQSLPALKIEPVPLQGQPGGIDPGVAPPTSAWCAREAVKKCRCSPDASNTGVTTVMSGRCVPPW